MNESTRARFAREGEVRINLLRLLSVAAFYVLHVVNRAFLGLEAGTSVDIGEIELPVFDTVALALAIAWGALGGSVLILVRSEKLWRGVAPLVSLADLAFLSVLLLIGNGPTSPLVMVFFPLIAASALRGQRASVWITVIGSLAAWGAAVALAANRQPDLLPPRHHLLVVTAGLGLTGVVFDVLLGLFWRAIDGQGELNSRVDVALGGPQPIAGACGWCGTRNPHTYARCARCDLPLDGSPPQIDVPIGARTPALLGWTFSVVVLVVLLLAIGIGLATQWPALLIPYAGVGGILLVALVRLVQLDLRADRDDQAIGTVARVLGTATAGLALSTGMVALSLVVSLLAVVAAATVAFVLCLAIVGSTR